MSRSSKNPPTVGSRVSAVKPPSATWRALPLVMASTSESKASSIAYACMVIQVVFESTARPGTDLTLKRSSG